MILELALGGAVLVTAGGALRWLLHRGARLQERRKDAGTAPGSAPRALAVGDVLLIDDDELWLAGGMWLEGDVSLGLFVTPGGERDGWLAELDLPAGADVVRLRPVDVPAGRVADEIRMGAERLRARSRARVAVRTEGEDLPPVTERADLTVLSGPGGRYAIVIDFIAGGRLALSGARVDPARIDHLPGGSHR